jgi:hypothetical protein
MEFDTDSDLDCLFVRHLAHMLVSKGNYCHSTFNRIRDREPPKPHCTSQINVCLLVVYLPIAPAWTLCSRTSDQSVDADAMLLEQ